MFRFKQLLDVHLDELTELVATENGKVLAEARGDVLKAIEVVDLFAPEHLQITTKDARADARRVNNAGAIFIGPFTPVAAGDYLAGPSHVLPTSGTGLRRHRSKYASFSHASTTTPPSS